MREDRELARLRRENRELRAKVKELEGGQPSFGATTDLYGEKNYFTYLRSRVKSKSFYMQVAKAWHYGRSSLFLTRLFRFLVLLYETLQTSAFVLLYTALFIVAIPFILALSAIVLILTLILRRRNADKLLGEVSKSILLLTVDGKEDFDPDAIRTVVAEHRDKTVIVVSPFFFRRDGIGEKPGAYVCYRREADGVYIVRIYFFFYLRRRLRALPACEIERISLPSKKEDA